MSSASLERAWNTCARYGVYLQLVFGCRHIGDSQHDPLHGTPSRFTCPVPHMDSPQPVALLHKGVQRFEYRPAFGRMVPAIWRIGEGCRGRKEKLSPSGRVLPERGHNPLRHAGQVNGTVNLERRNQLRAGAYPGIANICILVAGHQF